MPWDDDWINSGKAIDIIEKRCKVPDHSACALLEKGVQKGEVYAAGRLKHPSENAAFVIAPPADKLIRINPNDDTLTFCDPPPPRPRPLAKFAWISPEKS